MKIGGFGEFKDLRKTSAKRPVQAYDAAKRSSDGAGPRDASQASDAVELSPPARLMGKLGQVPDVRQERIEKIQSEIESGNYVTEERLRDGVRNLLKDL